MSALHPAVAALAGELEADQRLRTIAAVIRAGHVDLAPAIAADFTDSFGPFARDAELGRLYAEQVALWAAGDLGRLAAMNDAWGRNGCRSCARCALRSGDGSARCGLCSFNASAREALS